MAGFIGLFFALALSKHLLLQVTEHYRCSSSGISGFECLFMGTCDANGKPIDSLDIEMDTITFISVSIEFSRLLCIM